jgi:predicted membrane protein
VESKPGGRPTPQLVFGIVIIALGILFTLDNLGILHAGDYLRLWPALLVVFGLSQLLTPGEAPSRVVGLIFTPIGIILLLQNLNLVSLRIWELWPLILVVVGSLMIWQVLQRAGSGAGDRTLTVSALAILGGVQRTCSSDDFRGGELTAIMGGCEIDLREAVLLEDEATVHTFAFWGGIELKVPEEWTVIVEALPILGGFEERTHAPKEGPRKVLRIKGFAIMGGVEIHN